MSLQVQDGHWYERRDGKIVQAKPSRCSARLADCYLDGNYEVDVYRNNGRESSFGDKPADLIREVPPPTKLTLRVGGKYRRRDGEVVTIEREQRAYADGQLVYVAGNRWYLPNGTTYYEKHRETQNLVSEVLPEPPAKLSLKVGDRCLTRGGKEVVLFASPKSNLHRRTHPFCYSDDCGNEFTVRTNGAWSILGEHVDSRLDIVSVLPPLDPPAFRITAGEYYTTRDGRCAYVASGPVTMPDFYENGPAFFGTIGNSEDGNIFSAQCWEEDGCGYGEDDPTDFDLITPWSPPPYVCPHTGKTYNLVEAK